MDKPNTEFNRLLIIDQSKTELTFSKVAVKKQIKDSLIETYGIRLIQFVEILFVFTQLVSAIYIYAIVLLYRIRRYRVYLRIYSVTAILSLSPV